MPGVGTLIDMSGIIAGGATALAFGRLFSDQMDEKKCCRQREKAYILYVKRRR